MPPVTILSPYSGRPVKVREQDLGRALRDEQGRVFYLVEDPEHGRYAARTRKGSLKDLERYREIEGNVAKLEGEPELPDAPAAQVHDATGTKRRSPALAVAFLVVLGAIAAMGYIYMNHPQWLGLEPHNHEAPGDGDEAASEPTSQSTPAPSLNTSLALQPLPAANVAEADSTPSGITNQPMVLGASLPEGMDLDPQPVIVKTQARPRVTVLPATQPTPKPRRAKAPRTVPITLPAPRPRQTGYEDFRHTASGLRYKITHLTDGDSARAGNYVSIRYTAQTLDGKPLIDDASQSFILASGQAIRAFDEGLAGIREGEQLRLLVPRGHSDRGTLPGIERIPDMPFLLDVQLVSVRPGVTHIVESQGDIDSPPAMPGDTVLIHYLAKVEGRDEIIDATSHRGVPMRIRLGNNEVIQGLDLGITGMRAGESRQMTIPPYLAYGKYSVAGGLIPENAVLSFRVTLVGIEEDKQ